VQRAFSDAASIAPPINNSGELTVLVDDVKITHLKYPFPTFDPFMIYEQVPLLSVREIAATKAYTIGRFYLPSSVYLKPFARTIRKWIIVWISAHTRSCAICRGAYTSCSRNRRELNSKPNFFSATSIMSGSSASSKRTSCRQFTLKAARYGRSSDGGFDIWRIILRIN
jgi:hypothetical protein